MPYTLAPPPYQTVFDNAGALVPNACIWTYVAGTTTPAVTYSDALGTPNTNPIRADSAGRFTAYLEPGAGYRFVYELPATPPAHGAVLRTADNIVGTPAAPALLTGAWTPDLGGTATYTAREGTYVRLGPLVFVRGSLTVGGLGTGSAFEIFGLPFTPAHDAPGAVGQFTAAVFAYVSVGIYARAGVLKQLLLLGQASGAVQQIPAAVLTNGTMIEFAATYETGDP